MNQVRFVPISDILIENEYLRLDTKIEELKKSIKAIGLIHPLIINQENELIAGGRRYSALKELGFEQVPVVVVDQDRREQELISIDENLMRLPLKGLLLEKALNRGREIYEALYPEAKKVELTPVVKPKPEPSEASATPEDMMEDKVDGKASFVEVTAQKTGLSEGTIRSAIVREVKSSPKVKEARDHGELGAAQTNEIIKLEEDEQDKILSVVKNLPTKEVKKIVKEVQENGADATIERILSEEAMPKIYADFLTAASKAYRLCGRILKQKPDCPSSRTTEVLENIATGQELLQKLSAFVEEFEEEPQDAAPTSLPSYEEHTPSSALQSPETSPLAEQEASVDAPITA